MGVGLGPDGLALGPLPFLGLLGRGRERALRLPGGHAAASATSARRTLRTFSGCGSASPL
jgi:hypothetical protein